MSLQESLNAVTSIKAINILKIAVICFVGITMILFFDPFYERTEDSYFYGTSAMRIISGEYTYSNEFLQNTEHQEFVPSQWTETIQGDAVPIAFGRTSISTAVYGMFGLYGLFYFGPIATVALLIVSERVTTKLFGGMVGLIALLLLATSEMILYVGRVLLSDNFFTIFFVLGIFYLIKFYRHKKESHILLASAFLAFATFVRINGMISLPIELAVIGVVLVNQIRHKSPLWEKTSSKTCKAKNYSVFAAKAAIPWIIVIMVIFSYNSHFFGSPLESSINSTIDKGFVKSLTNTEPADRLDNFLSYSNSILPSPLNRIQYFAQDYDERLDQYYPAISSAVKPILTGSSGFNFGIITIIVLAIGILVSVATKQKYFEVVLYSAFIFGFLFVFSKSFVVDRYMLPLLPLFFAILGYLITRPFNINPKKKNPILAGKISTVVIVGTFFVFAFYLSEPVQILKVEGYDITNPAEKAQRYPLDREGLSENSIVFGVLSSKTIEYGLVPFNPIYEHPKKIEFDEKYVLPESIDLIDTMMQDGYSFYSFKEPQSHLDKQFLRYLVENHHFVLKDHSPSFCKLEPQTNRDQKSDKACF